MYVNRGLEERLRTSLGSSALVILEGARATGKTWLVQRAIEQGWLSEFRSFIDQSELNAAQAAPRDYVFGLPHGTVIDEAQLCEEILLPVKERVEQSSVGSLLLTGSTRLRRDGLGGSDPLAGRVGSPLHLAPLTIGERGRDPVQLVGQLFDEAPKSIELGAPIGRTELVELVKEPGLPEFVTDLNPAARDDRARSYISQVTSLSSFASVDVQRVGQLARYLAGRTSTPVNINQFASGVELSRQSVTKYLAHLEEALVIIRLPAWRRTKDKSETAQAKIHFFDAGVACAVGRMQPSERDDELGRLVETLLVTDLVRQTHWLPDPPSCYHWRNKERDEVDLVLEASDGRSVCVEVKAAETVSVKDFRGIDAFKESHPDSFHRGFVFYSGSKVQPFGDDRWAIPFAALRSPSRMEPMASSAPRRSLLRESTEDLWERMLLQLSAMTSNGIVEWEDGRQAHAFTATTESGAITLVRKVRDLGLSDTITISTQLSGLAGLPDEIALRMYDADGELISSLDAAQEPYEGRIMPLERSVLGHIDPAEEAGQSRVSRIYESASQLLSLIESTPAPATSVADRILDDFGST